MLYNLDFSLLSATATGVANLDFITAPTRPLENNLTFVGEAVFTRSATSTMSLLQETTANSSSGIVEDVVIFSQEASNIREARNQLFLSVEATTSHVQDAVTSAIFTQTVSSLTYKSPASVLTFMSVADVLHSSESNLLFTQSDTVSKDVNCVDYLHLMQSASKYVVNEAQNILSFIDVTENASYSNLRNALIVSDDAVLLHDGSSYLVLGQDAYLGSGGSGALNLKQTAAYTKAFQREAVDLAVFRQFASATISRAVPSATPYDLLSLAHQERVRVARASRKANYVFSYDVLEL